MVNHSIIFNAAVITESNSGH